MLLVALGHPQVEGAGIEVGAQAAGVGAGGATADPVGVEGVLSGSNQVWPSVSEIHWEFRKAWTFAIRGCCRDSIWALDQ